MLPKKSSKRPRSAQKSSAAAGGGGAPRRVLLVGKKKKAPGPRRSLTFDDGGLTHFLNTRDAPFPMMASATESFTGSTYKVKTEFRITAAAGHSHAISLCKSFLHLQNMAVGAPTSQFVGTATNPMTWGPFVTYDVTNPALPLYGNGTSTVAAGRPLEGAVANVTSTNSMIVMASCKSVLKGIELEVNQIALRDDRGFTVTVTEPHDGASLGYFVTAAPTVVGFYIPSPNDIAAGGLATSKVHVADSGHFCQHIVASDCIPAIAETSKSVFYNTTVTGGQQSTALVPPIAPNYLAINIPSGDAVDTDQPAAVDYVAHIVPLDTGNATTFIVTLTAEYFSKVYEPVPLSYTHNVQPVRQPTEVLKTNAAIAGKQAMIKAARGLADKAGQTWGVSLMKGAERMIGSGMIVNGATRLLGNGLTGISNAVGRAAGNFAGPLMRLGGRAIGADLPAIAGLLL